MVAAKQRVNALFAWCNFVVLGCPEAEAKYKPHRSTLELPAALGFGCVVVEVRTVTAGRALLGEIGLPGWKLDRVLRSVTVRRVRQLKRDFTPVEAKVDALAEGVDEMRKALHFVQNQLPKEQLVALGTVHAKVDARLSGVEGQLNGIAAALEQLAELDDARFS